MRVKQLADLLGRKRQWYNREGMVVLESLVYTAMPLILLLDYRDGGKALDVGKSDVDGLLA